MLCQILREWSNSRAAFSLTKYIAVVGSILGVRLLQLKTMPRVAVFYGHSQIPIKVRNVKFDFVIRFSTFVSHR